MDPTISPSHEQEHAALFAKYPHFRKVFETGIESHDGREQTLLAYILSHPNILDFKQDPIKLLNAMDQFSNKHEFLISIGPHKAAILSPLITQQKPKSVLELGGYLGYSAILFAHTMLTASNGNASSLQVFSLELSDEFATIARKMVELAGLSSIVTVVVGEAATTLPLLKAEGKLSTGIDILFLDHVEDLYLPDFKVCQNLGLLKKGCIVIADNVVRPGAPAYREFMRGLKGWKSKGVRGLIQPGDFEDELEVSYCT